MPPSSAPTCTARAATSVPTASREPCHSAGCTLAEVTDSGGWVKAAPAAIMVRICRNLTPTSTPRMTASTRIASNQSLDLVFIVA